MLGEDNGFTLQECRFRCEILGEKCNAFTWGPNLWKDGKPGELDATKERAWKDWKYPGSDLDNIPKVPKTPFKGSCHILQKVDQCSAFNSDLDKNFECHKRVVQAPTYRIQKYSYQAGHCTAKQGGSFEGEEEVGTDLGVPLGLGSHGDGCRIHCNNDPKCDAWEYTRSTKSCKIFKGKGIRGVGDAEVWMQVRHFPAGPDGWKFEMDNLRGSETFGERGVEDKAWAIAFDDLEVSKVRVRSLDGTYERQYDNGGRRIINRLSQQDFFARSEHQDAAHVLKLGAEISILTKDYDCAVKINDNFENPPTKSGGALPPYACHAERAKDQGNVLELAKAMKEAEGEEAEKAKREGRVLMVFDPDFVWSLHACKNRCNQVKECSAFTFNQDKKECYIVVPKPEEESETNFDEIFEKSREGICDTSGQESGGTPAEYQIDQTLKECMSACAANRDCKKILFSTFVDG